MTGCLINWTQKRIQPPVDLPPFSSPDDLGSLAPKGCEGLAPALGSDFSSHWLFLQTLHCLLLLGLSN